MTSINMPRDDAALHSTKSSPNRTVNETQPYPTTQPVQKEKDVTSAPPKKPQANQQRRKRDRRKKDIPVLLDTRSGHDRRNAAQDDEQGKADDKTSGIDIYT